METKSRANRVKSAACWENHVTLKKTQRFYLSHARKTCRSESQGENLSVQLLNAPPCPPARLQLVQSPVVPFLEEVEPPTKLSRVMTCKHKMLRYTASPQKVSGLEGFHSSRRQILSARKHGAMLICVSRLAHNLRADARGAFVDCATPQRPKHFDWQETVTHSRYESHTHTHIIRHSLCVLTSV